MKKTGMVGIGLICPCLMEQNAGVGLCLADDLYQLPGIRRVGFGNAAEMACLLNGNNIPFSVGKRFGKGGFFLGQNAVHLIDIGGGAVMKKSDVLFQRTAPNI